MKIMLYLHQRKVEFSRDWSKKKIIIKKKIKPYINLFTKDKDTKDIKDAW